MTINGYNYTKNEVLAALQKRGYEIVKWECTWIDETFPNGTTVETEIVDCAIKPTELPYDENIWYKVADQEFKVKEKPKLV